MLLAGLVEMKLTGRLATQIELATHSMVDVVSTSTLLKGLEERGLVTRDQRNRDKRMRYLTITPEGEKLVRDALKAVRQFDRQFFEDIAKPQLNAFLKVCQQLN